jgi:hypothetical protein
MVIILPVSYPLTFGAILYTSEQKEVYYDLERHKILQLLEFSPSQRDIVKLF